jgi:hypothetical protein
MMADGVLETHEGPIVHEGRHQRVVPQWRGAKHVAVFRIARDLLEAEILIRVRAVEGHIPEGRRHLWHPDHVLPEVAEHLVRLAAHAVTLHAPGLPEEEQRPPLLALRERVAFAARKAADRTPFSIVVITGQFFHCCSLRL